jgi:hypothetical protein
MTTEATGGAVACLDCYRKCMGGSAPLPAPSVPIPYPNLMSVHQGRLTTSGKMKVATKEAITRKSQVSRSSGDEAGTLKGLISLKSRVKVTGKVSTPHGK